MFRKLNLPLLAAVAVLSVAVGLGLRWQFGSDWWEFAGFVTGVVGVYLVAIEHMINWPVGLVNVLIYGWVFYASRLFADMSLQFFFFALGVYGWIAWAKGGTGRTELKISRISWTSWAAIAAIWAVGTAIYVPIITFYKGASPFVDSALTVASIIAQMLLNHKKIENWMIWILVDAIYLPLYISRGLVATAVLYALLLGLAISGLIIWSRLMRTQGIGLSGNEVPSMPGPLSEADFRPGETLG